MSKYRVSIRLEVEEIDQNGVLSPYFESTNTYGSLPYDGVVLIEQHMLGVLNSLGEEGVRRASPEMQKKLTA